MTLTRRRVSPKVRSMKLECRTRLWCPAGKRRYPRHRCGQQSFQGDVDDRPWCQLAAAAVRLAAVSGSFLGSGTGDERGTLGVRGDVLLGVALQASLMAECLAGGAGDAEGGISVSELVGASPVSEYEVDGDFGLCRTRRSS
jgi:hypothetical protein